MKNNKLNIFRKLQIKAAPQQALYLTWDELSDYFNKMLTEVCNREIRTQATLSDYYYWEINILNTSITEDEINVIFELIDADGHDIDSNTVKGCDIMELTNSVSLKLISKSLPFPAINSISNEEGVWFIGSPDMSIKPDRTNDKEESIL